MQPVTGPARYFFLRRELRAREEVAGWPPEVKPLELPENRVCLGVRLHAAEGGWRAEPVEEGALATDGAGALLLTRETTLGIVRDGTRGGLALALLGVRVAAAEDGTAEFATHLVVRIAEGGGLGMPKRPVLAPIAALMLSAYVEHGSTAEAQLDLRLGAEEVAALTPYLPDPVILRLARAALDQAVPSLRARHDLTLEALAGRVSLYGRAELTAFGEQAREELLATPGVVEVADHLVYDERIEQQVEVALAAKGFGDLRVLSEHNLIELHGRVPDSAALHRAREIALRIPGVRGVVTNQLVVEAPPFAEKARGDGAPAEGTPSADRTPAVTS